MTDAQLNVLLQVVHKMLAYAINGVRKELPEEMATDVKVVNFFNPEQTRKEFPILDPLYEVLNQLENCIDELKVPVNSEEK